MSSASTLVMFGRLLLSLGVVIGLMWFAANVLRKRGFSPAAAKRGMRGPDVELLARRQINRNATIAVVRVADRSFVVGVTDHQVTMLDNVEIDDISVEEGNTWTVPSGANAPTPTWKTMLEQMRAKTARH